MHYKHEYCMSPAIGSVRMQQSKYGRIAHLLVIMYVIHVCDMHV